MNKKSFPLDVENGLLEFDNDIAFYKELVYDFFEHVEKRILIMETALTENDTAILKNEVHAIKGGAANLDANDLFESASEMESIVSLRQEDQYITGVKDIKNEFLRLKEYVSNYDLLKQ